MKRHSDPVRQALHCPDWCELPIEKHRVEAYNGAVCIDHEGPGFGDYVIWAETKNSSLRCVEVALRDGSGHTVAELRQAAADALAAAEWLGAHAI